MQFLKKNVIQYVSFVAVRSKQSKGVECISKIYLFGILSVTTCILSKLW